MKRFIPCLALISIIANADPVELPDDGDWYQLQSTGGEETFCQTGDLTCDVPSGTEVKLINHSLPSSDPNHKIVFIVGSNDTPAPTAGIELIYQPAVATGIDTDGGSTFLTIPCPENTVPIAANCDFHTPGADGGVFPLEAEKFIGEDSVTCGILGSPQNTRGEKATFQGSAICAIGTVVSTLPVIDETVR